MNQTLSIAPFLDGLVVRPGASYQGLHIFPVCLVSSEFERTDESLASLSEGLQAGRLLIGETGRMETVRVRNAGAASVLLLDGETLIGGAQNRMLSAAAVVPPRLETELASSCVEVHRWDIKSQAGIPDDRRAFQRSAMAYGALRRLRMELAHKSLRAARTVHVDQKAVWKNIAMQFGVSGAHTKTLDMHDLYDFWDAALRIFEPRFYIHRNQIGIISFHDKCTWFVDLFRNHDMLYKYFKPLVRSYALDALIRLQAETPARGKPQLEDARNLFKSLRTAMCHSFPVTGGAHGMYFSTRSGLGTTLTTDSRIVQLSACSMQRNQD